MWTFNSEVARNFSKHARQHIPNYDNVIDKTIKICSTKNKDSKIIDVGCAVGETISRLYNSGFTNLFGVDSSIDMLECCPKDIATYFLDAKFPKDNFDIVIANWTLHFIENKIEYARSIYDNLNENGLLILSEKTTQDQLSKRFYYSMKEANGVSMEEIVEKEKNLKDVMFIKSVPWYFETLTNIGFKNINVFDADWCFTSFVCEK